MKHTFQGHDIGKIISVSGNEFIIELSAHLEKNRSLRLGAFLLIPVGEEYIVVEVTRLRDRDANHTSSFTTMRETEARFLDAIPVGMLPFDTDAPFRFGVTLFPSLNASVLEATSLALDRVFGNQDNSQQFPESPVSIAIGQSIVIENTPVQLRIKDFFSSHVAVLGNTGSGKSCTIASVLQALFSQGTALSPRGATFILFDVNGEYSRAFDTNDKGELSHNTTLKVDKLSLDTTLTKTSFRLPHWYLNYTEWEQLLWVSQKEQMPILRNALGLTEVLNKNEQTVELLRQHFVALSVLESLQGSNGDSPISKFQRISSLISRYGTPRVKQIFEYVRQYYNLQTGAFSNLAINTNLGLMRPQDYFMKALEACRIKDFKFPVYRNQPFKFDVLEECIDLAILYEEAYGNMLIRDYCAPMITRFNVIKELPEYSFLRFDISDKNNLPTTDHFLMRLLGSHYVGDDLIKDKQIIILDMNAVDDEIISLVTAVIGRLIFQKFRYASPRNTFPVHLILEEAHRYISSTPARFSVDTNYIYERIAKEGRKYGLFLIVSSQRPSELSKVVLSQCLNYIVHRIQNPEDLQLIRQMTPFISDPVLKRLPALPKQHALVFGPAVNLPMTFKVREASPRPMSDDTKIQDLWFQEKSFKPALSLSREGYQLKFTEDVMFIPEMEVEGESDNEGTSREDKSKPAEPQRLSILTSRGLEMLRRHKSSEQQKLPLIVPPEAPLAEVIPELQDTQTEPHPQQPEDKADNTPEETK